MKGDREKARGSDEWSMMVHDGPWMSMQLCCETFSTSTGLPRDWTKMNYLCAVSFDREKLRNRSPRRVKWNLQSKEMIS